MSRVAIQPAKRFGSISPMLMQQHSSFTHSLTHSLKIQNHFHPFSLTFRNIYAFVTFIIRCTPQDTIFVPYAWKLSSSSSSSLKKPLHTRAFVRFIPLRCSHTHSSSFSLYFWILLLTHKVSNSEITNLLSIYVLFSKEEDKNNAPWLYGSALKNNAHNSFHP